METVVECVVTDEIVLDKLVFKEWVCGRTAADAAREKERDLARWLLAAKPPHKIENHLDPKWRMVRSINMQECLEQFQLYEWITPFLNDPTQFYTQSLFVLQPSDIAYMIEANYSYDEVVMRDLLGKALTKAASRDVQDQAEILGTKVNSVRRQFDNLKRILMRVEFEMANNTASKGSHSARTVLGVLTEDFKLSVELASQYQHLAFLCYNKIETSKSRLNVLDFSEWSSMAGVVMAFPVRQVHDSLGCEGAFLSATVISGAGHRQWPMAFVEPLYLCRHAADCRSAITDRLVAASVGVAV